MLGIFFMEIAANPDYQLDTLTFSVTHPTINTLLCVL